MTVGTRIGKIPHDTTLNVLFCYLWLLLAGSALAVQWTGAHSDRCADPPPMSTHPANAAGRGGGQTGAIQTAGRARLDLRVGGAAPSTEGRQKAL